MRVEFMDDATLYCGDCLDVLSKISGVDALISDSPYGVTNNTWDMALDWTAWWNMALTTAKHNAAFALFSA